VRNFLAGLLLGVLSTYYYLTQGSEVRLMVEALWARASSAPAAHGRR
jgi:hypothetical protein